MVLLNLTLLDLGPSSSLSGSLCRDLLPSSRPTLIPSLMSAWFCEFHKPPCCVTMVSMISRCSVMSQWILGSWALQCHNVHYFHELSQCSKALLSSRVSRWPLGPRGHHGVKFFSFHESLQYCNCLLDIGGPAVSQCHNSPKSNSCPLVPWGPAVSPWPHCYTRFHSITMVSLFPQGQKVSQLFS